MRKRPNRWDGVYQTKTATETSWFEAKPEGSLDLIAVIGVPVDAAIVDVGRRVITALGQPS